MSRTLETTTSLCPACLEPCPGTYREQDGAVHLERTCPEHGAFSAQVWASADHWAWASGYAPAPEPTGDLPVRNDHACLAVVEITRGCNLSCPFCFAASGPVGDHLSVEEVVELLEVVRADGGPRPIQFSGGEPTIHPDLPELVETACRMGFEHIEVNTNGLRLAKDAAYAETLAQAGVTAIYLQFDGFEASTYEQVRGRDLVKVKERALEHSRQAGLPVILVCTAVPGTNDHELGDIVTFALDNRDVVRSVNIQPVAHFGRHGDQPGRRFSLDEVAARLSEQTGFLEPRDFRPVPCCSAYCQSATALVPDGDGGAAVLTRYVDDELFEQLSELVDEADWMELLAGTQSARDRSEFVAACCGIEVPGGAAELLDHVLPVALSGFMDADAADVERLGNCCIAVPTKEDGLVPFCAYNMTTRDGRYALREKHGWEGRRWVQ